MTEENGSRSASRPDARGSPAPCMRRIGQDLFRATGWMKLLGVLMIVYGVLAALTIVGILIAWLPIWAGILLLQAATAADRADREEDDGAFARSLSRLRLFFTLMGITALVLLAVEIITTLLGVGMMMPFHR